MLRCPRPALLRTLRAAALASLVCLALLLPTTGRGQEAPTQDYLTYLSTIRFSYPPAVIVLRVEDVRDWLRLPGGPPTNTQAVLFQCEGPFAITCEDEAERRRADNDGVIVFSGVQAGYYELEISANGYQSLRSLMFPVSQDARLESRVDLAPAMPVEITLAGTLVDEEGEPLPAEVATRLRISPVRCNTPGCTDPRPASLPVYADSTGAFRAPIPTYMAAGYFRIGVTDPTNGEYPEALSPVTSFVLPGETKVLEPLSMKLHSVLLRGRIVDSATGEPPANVAGAQVYLELCTDRACEWQTRRGMVNPEGRFTVSAPGPGRYSLTISLPPYDRGGLPMLDLVAVDRRELGDIPLETLRYARSVDGRLLSGGEPADGAWLGYYRYRFDRCFSDGSTTADSLGAFRFPTAWQRMAAGDFLLRSSGPAGLVRYHGPFALAEDEALNLGDLVVSAPDGTAAGVISGRLAFSATEGIQPVPGTATLYACGPCGCQDSVLSVGSSAAGEFAFDGASSLPAPLPPGRYLIGGTGFWGSSTISGYGAAFEVSAGEDVALGDVLLAPPEAAEAVPVVPAWLYEYEAAQPAAPEPKPPAEMADELGWR